MEASHELTYIFFFIVIADNFLAAEGGGEGVKGVAAIKGLVGGVGGAGGAEGVAVVVGATAGVIGASTGGALV